MIPSQSQRIDTMARLNDSWIGSADHQQRKRMRRFVVEDDLEEGAVDVHPVIAVVKEAVLAESSHEETDAGARCADHLGEHFLADLRNDRLRLAVSPEVGH